MIRIPYGAMVALISVLWCINRAMTGWKNKKFDWKRELQLLLVYICIVVIVRFTFCPFGKVDGKIQPLILDLENIWPFRINLIPFIYMADNERSCVEFCGKYFDVCSGWGGLSDSI